MNSNTDTLPDASFDECTDKQMSDTNNMVRNRKLKNPKLNYEIPLTNEPATYMIYEPSTDKTYVGATGNIGKRMVYHERDLRNNRHGNQGLQEIYNKNNGNLKVSICLTETRDLARKLEQDIIDTYLDTGMLVNVSNNRSNLLVYAKQSIGSKRSPEICRRISEGHMGIEFTDEHRRSISLAKKFPVTINGTEYVNIPNAMRELNVTRTEVLHLAGIREPCKTPVSINGVEYSSITEAQNKLNIPRTTLKEWLNSDAEKHKGYFRLAKSDKDKRTD